MKGGLHTQKIYKKISYLRGLCDGYGFDENTKEGKVFNGIFDILDEVAINIEVIKYENDNELINEDYDEENEDGYSFICPNCGEEVEIDEEILMNDKEVACSQCGSLIPICSEDFNLKF